MRDKYTINVKTRVHDSFRVQQISGIFDVSHDGSVSTPVSYEHPPLDQEWRIGLIVGPSGSGKTTVAKEIFKSDVYKGYDWKKDRAFIDCFDEHPIKRIINILTIVGFSSPPSWIKPYDALSNGEKFRCDLAKAMLDTKGDTVVFDEYTSVVDRTVARTVSAAVFSGVRKKIIEKKFVAVTCHYDVVDWLTPDWVLDMSTGEVTRRCLRRPEIKLQIVGTTRKLWSCFARYHYLNSSLNKAAKCFLAIWDGAPVAFCAVLPLMGKFMRRRVSRLVVLPDYQGIGIGSSFLKGIGHIYHLQNCRLNITTGHPAMISHCSHSQFWKTVSIHRAGSASIQFNKRYNGSRGRAVVSFEYIGG